MQPEINVLGLSIKTFGLFFALNFVAWGALVGRRLRELGKPVDWAYEMVAAALVGGLIGARGYWLVQNHESFSVGSVLGGSGLIWYGGLLGGVAFVLLWARWRGVLPPPLGRQGRTRAGPPPAPWRRGGPGSGGGGH